MSQYSMPDGAAGPGGPTIDGSDVFEAEFATPSRPPGRRMSRRGLFVVVGALSLLAVAIVCLTGPSEIAKWHQAAAEEQWLDGDREGAIRSLGKAIARFPTNNGLLRRRASWLLLDGQHDRALADCDAILKRAPEDVETIHLRGRILQSQGEFEQAVDEYERYVEIERRAGVDLRGPLNDLAYARALAKSELDVALEEIEEALDGAVPNAATLDTRGFIRYLRGDPAQALTDLNQSVAIAEATYQILAKRQPGGNQVGTVDLRETQQALEAYAESVAVIRYHRSLVHAALGDEASAEADRQRVVELGHEPGPSLF